MPGLVVAQGGLSTVFTPQIEERSVGPYNVHAMQGVAFYIKWRTSDHTIWH